MWLLSVLAYYEILGRLNSRKNHPAEHFSPLTLVWFAVDTEIYPLKMASEWKYALEKSLIDAAKFPLPMEVFKVRWEFIAIYLLLFKNEQGDGGWWFLYQIFSHCLKSYLLGQFPF